MRTEKHSAFLWKNSGSDSIDSESVYGLSQRNVESTFGFKKTGVGFAKETQIKAQKKLSFRKIF